MKNVLLIAGLAMTLLVSGCGDSGGDDGAADGPADVASADDDGTSGGGDVGHGETDANADGEDAGPTGTTGTGTGTDDAWAPQEDGGASSEDATVEGSDLGTEPPEEEDPTQALFPLDEIVMVEIEIDEADWEELLSQKRTFLDLLAGEDCNAQPFAKPFTWFTATVTVDGVTLEDVAVRKKGFIGSLSDWKPSLKFKFDKYVPDQLLHGSERMTLNNQQQDPSRLNTCMAYHVFERAGYPAPRCAFAHVTVNGEALGVYATIDAMKKPYLRRHFDDDEGSLYEGTVSDFRPSMRGTFEQKTNIDAGPVEIDAAVAALAIPDEGWRAAVEEVFDIDRFLTFWALEVLVGHWDSYTGNRNNFFFYADPSDGDRLVFLPWGPDSSFKPLSNPFDEIQYPAAVQANSILPNRMFNDPDYRAAYLLRLAEVVEEVWDEEALLARVDLLESVVHPHMPVWHQQEAAEDTDRIRWFIGQQKQAVLDSIADDPDWPYPVDGLNCWIPAGEVAAEFETVWGTAGDDSPLSIGDATFSEFSFDGESFSFNDTGATIGHHEEEEGLLTLLVAGLRGAIFEGFVLEMAIEDFHPNTTLPLDLETVSGWRLIVPPPYDQFNFGGSLAWGTLSFEEVSTEDGGTVKGSLETAIFPP